MTLVRIVGIPPTILCRGRGTLDTNFYDARAVALRRFLNGAGLKTCFVRTREASPAT
jgi:hypothetical protein